jgi:LmbE family N-acetylglucosaminyl deacetylase
MDWGNRRVVVVTAHPDDEVLGCGATLAHIANAGAEVTVVLATRRVDERGRREWSRLVAAFEKSCARLGATAVFAEPLLDEDRAALDLHDLHDAIVPYVDDADLVLTHHHGDVHQTHRGVARAVEIATRPFRRRREVLLFEVPTSTDQGFDRPFAPQAYAVLDQSDVDAALEALSYYTSEIEAGHDPEVLEAHLRARGAEVGAPYAEAFQQVRRFL